MPLVVVVNSSSITVNVDPTADYKFFIQPYVNNIELLRNWLMTPESDATLKAGYDPNYGLIRGGHWNGSWHNGMVLIDANLLTASTLDYLNTQKGISTNVLGSVRQWLDATTFTDPTGVNPPATYQGDDRREILFGTVLPCVNDTSGQVYYAPGHTSTDVDPIVTALPTTCHKSTTTAAMDVFAIQTALLYLTGQVAAAKAMFDQTVTAWTPSVGTGLGGTTGGEFSPPFDGASNCHHTRNLGYWIAMARATGFWINQQTITQQALNELWAHQVPSTGGILVNYPACGSQVKDTGESAGITLLSIDPRLPGWFGN